LRDGFGFKLLASIFNLNFGRRAEALLLQFVSATKLRLRFSVMHLIIIRRKLLGLGLKERDGLPEALSLSACGRYLGYLVDFSARDWFYMLALFLVRLVPGALGYLYRYLDWFFFIFTVHYSCILF
jgi:hypothetical protein